MKLADVYAELGTKDNLDAGLNQAKGKLNSWASNVSSKMGQALTFAAGALIAQGLNVVAGGVKALGNEMIGGNAAFEQYGVQFEVLLKSATAAKARLAELQAFNVKTPFELPELIQADTVLQSFGFHAEDAAKRFGFSGAEIRRIAGDVASGSKAKLEEVATYLGRFAAGQTGLTLSRFEELGIVTRQQLKGLGLAFDGQGALIVKSQEDIDRALTILLQQMNEKYAGLMDKQSQTLNGMKSNLSDWFSNAARIVGEPLFDALKTDAQSLLTLLNSPAAQGAVNGLANGVRTFFDWYREAIGTIRDLFADTGVLGNIRTLLTLLSGSQAASTDWGAVMQWVVVQLGNLIIEVNQNIEYAIALLRTVGTVGRDVGQIIQGVFSLIAGSGMATITMMQQLVIAVNELRQGHVALSNEALAKAAAAAGAVTVFFNAMDDVGATAFDRISQAARDLGVELGEINKKASQLRATLGARGAGLTGLGVDDVRAEMAAMRALGRTGVTAAETTEDAWNDTGDGISSAMSQAADSMRSYFDNAISTAQGALKGLLPEMFPSDLFAPGANGPFENIFRAADVAKQGDASPWAAKLGLTQEQAKKIVSDFARGLFTEDVKGLIDMQALIDDARLKQAAETMKAKFVGYLAGAAGVSRSVADSLLGTETGVADVQTKIADPLIGAFERVTTAINNLIAALERLAKTGLPKAGAAPPAGTGGTGGTGGTSATTNVFLSPNASQAALAILRSRGR